jgi:phosphoribosyl-AMP cyclohydrolase
MKIPAQIQEALSKGLIAAIVQDAKSSEVLMLAWMNEAALLQTLQTKRATYFSRSRNALWVKGETSGHFQEVVDIKFDCDADAILMLVNQIGAACHTGQKSCFHNELI